ncbi:MAG: hypothetical protein RR565_04345 [Erysipelothrix sp.]
MKKIIMVLIMSVMLVGCSSGKPTETKEEENTPVNLPTTLQFNGQEISFAKGLTIADFSEYKIKKIVPPAAVKKDAKTITFSYYFDIDGSILEAGFKTKYYGSSSIPKETEEVQETGELHYYSFKLEDLQQGVAIYNGVDIKDINEDILKEWGWKPSNETLARDSFEFDKGSIDVLYKEGTRDFKTVTFYPKSDK